MRTRKSGLYFSAMVLTILAGSIGRNSLGQDASSAMPKPNFVFHDQSLHLQKPQTVLNHNGSFSVNAGTSDIQVSSLCFSADGKLLAVGSTPGIVDVWSVETRQKIAAFKGGTSVALSPDGRLLEKDGNGIEFIDMPSGKINRTIP